MKKICCIIICLLFFAVFLTEGAKPASAEPALYMVTADIVAATEKPGMTYEREAHSIPEAKGLKAAFEYGRIIKAVPLTEGKFANLWAEVFNDERGSSIGYVDMAALAPMPKVEYFAEPEPCRFTVDSPPLFLIPGSYSILDYTLPDDEPFYVLAGEVESGVGTFRDASGQDWTLLNFSYRYAWTQSENVMRLPQYAPDHTKVDPALVPGSVRDFGKVENKFRESLLKNGFALDAAPIIHDQLSLDDLVESYPGEELDSDVFYTPNFVTTDVFLHTFHLVFSRGLKKIEEVNFAPALEKMLGDSLKKLDALEKKSGKNAKAVFAHARDFLTVPLTLCAPDQKLSKLSARARAETDLVLKAEKIEESAISGKKEDYTFYKPRGHYTASEQLSRYFRAMAYLGGISFQLETGDPKRDRDNTALTALLCVLFEDKDLHKQWNYIFEPLTYLIGAADDPTINDFTPIVKKILNGKLDKLTDAKTLDAMRKELIAATPKPRIIDVPTGNVSQEEREEIASGLRLLGRRFVLDAWVFGQLTSPNVGSDSSPRNLPKVADVMAALGSNIADAELEADRKDIPKYAAAFEKVKKEVYSFFEEWDGTFVSAWLGTLGIYLTDKDSKQFFWNSPLWEAKKLLTASASWTELKHDTVLYAKQNYAEMGAGEGWDVTPFIVPTPLGYVEPSPRTFGAIANALSRFGELIDKFELGERKGDANYWNGIRPRVEAILEFVTLFRDIAEKEVREEPLSRDDYYAIWFFKTRYLNSNLLLDGIAEEGNSDQLKMALVSDVATDAFDERVLHVATGTPRRLYVFVNDKWGGPRVTIGYTYSFYEFPRSMSDGRMTDEEWKKLVYDKARQSELEKLAPQWSKDLFVR
ncbi:MAG: DUF3160 domain-containing protein [Synergistaceae bacterium]|nr:DUF3160 domain-containing protein [Synergistaceae bacterium]